MRTLSLLALIPAVSLATTQPSAPPHQEQEQGQSQHQQQSVELSTASEAAATSGGNTITNETDYPRQAPSVVQGSFAISGCGAGGNAGGSNTHGSAFLGFAWTPKDCKLLLAASAYQSLGMYDAACEMVNGLTAVRKQWAKTERKEPPPCDVKPPEPVKPVGDQVQVTVNVPPATAVDTSQFVRRDEMAERDRRIIEAVGSK